RTSRTCFLTHRRGFVGNSFVRYFLPLLHAPGAEDIKQGKKIAEQASAVRELQANGIRQLSLQNGDDGTTEEAESKQSRSLSGKVTHILNGHCIKRWEENRNEESDGDDGDNCEGPFGKHRDEKARDCREQVECDVHRRLEMLLDPRSQQPAQGEDRKVNREQSLGLMRG
ncbi:MAG: hypothetical protein ABSF53_28080, partial [Terracidiphilus sp.]